MSDSAAFSKKGISAFKVHAEHCDADLEGFKYIKNPTNVSGPKGDFPESSY